MWLFFVALLAAAARGTFVVGDVDVLLAEQFSSGAAARAEEIVVLRQSDGERHPLLFASEELRRRVRGGRAVNVSVESAPVLRSSLPVDVGGNAYYVVDAADAAAKTRNAGTAPFETNYRRVMAVVVNFADVKDNNCTTDMVYNVLFGPDDSVAEFYRRETNGKIHLVDNFKGDVGERDIFGPVSISVDVSLGCAPYDWEEKTIKELENRGVDVKQYDHRIFVLPYTELCVWEGLANVACGDSCSLWTRGCYQDYVIKHELGHNFGLHHSGLRSGEVGTFAEYGDCSSVMGNCWSRNEKKFGFIAPQMLSEHWLPGHNSLEARQSGNFMLYPLDLESAKNGTVQVLVINAPDTDYNFYLSFRADRDYELSNMVLVHKWRGYGNVELVAVLSEGGLFRDLSFTFSAEIMSLSTARAHIAVRFNCHKADPVLELIQSVESREVHYAANSTIELVENANLTLTLYNADSGACLYSRYSLEKASPESVPFSPQTFTMWPGNACEVILEVDEIKDLRNLTLNLTDIENPWRSFLTYFTFTPMSTKNSRPFIVTKMTDVDGFSPTIAGSDEVSFLVQNVNNFDAADQRISVSPVLYNCPDGVSFSVTYNCTSLKSGAAGVAKVKVNVKNDMSLLGTRCSLSVSNITLPIAVYRRCEDERQPNITLSVPKTMNSGTSIHIPIVVTDSERKHCVYPLEMTTNAGGSKIESHLLKKNLVLHDGYGYSAILVATKDSLPDDNSLTVSLGVGHFPAITTNIALVQSVCDPLLIVASSYDALVRTEDKPKSFEIAVIVTSYDTRECGMTEGHLSATASEGYSVVGAERTVQIYPYEIFRQTLTVNIDKNIEEEENAKVNITFKRDIMNKTEEFLMTVSVDVGLCVHSAPLLTPKSEDENGGTTWVNERRDISVVVENTDTRYCTPRTFTVSVEQEEHDRSASVSFITSSSGLMYPRATRTFTFGAIGRTNMDVGLAAYVEHKVDGTKYREGPLVYNYSVSSACSINNPKIESSVDNISFSIGPEKFLSVLLTVTNKNGGSACVPTLYEITPTLADRMEIVESDVPVLNLSDGESGYAYYMLKTKENSPSNVYYADFQVYDVSRPYFNSYAPVGMHIECPLPETPYAIEFEHKTPVFGTSSQIQLSWRGCDSPLTCCCPCTFDIYRDGKKVGTSTTNSFTDEDALDESKAYNYTIVAIDVNGARSPWDTCYTTVMITPEDADLESLFVLLYCIMALLCFLIIASFIYIVHLKKKYRHLPQRQTASSPTKPIEMDNELANNIIDIVDMG